MRIRTATVDDADQLAQVHVDAWRAAYGHILPAGFLAGLSVAARAERWRERLAQEDPQVVFTLVAEDAAGLLLGFAGGGPERDGTPAYDGEIYAVYVTPAHQRRGIGRALVAASARRLADQGRRAAMLWALEDNHQARAFYETLGGQLIGRKAAVIGDTPLTEVSYGWPDVSDLLRCDLKLTHYETPSVFLARVQAFLEQAEAANNLLLGIAVRLAEHPDRTKQPPYLATVEADGALVVAAVMTPPHRVLLSSAAGADPAPLRLVMDDLRAGSWGVPGVMASAATSAAFAQLWSAATAQPHRPGMHERVYELCHVIPPARVSGSLRPATEADLPLAADWAYRFMQDAGLPGGVEDAREIAELRIADRDLFLWDDGGPAAMAAKTRHTVHGYTIGLVYTPGELRGRGYASACVAALSQQLLDAGWQFCTLFTDLANPTSNSIYQRIGYRPVCDFDEYDFET